MIAGALHWAFRKSLTLMPTAVTPDDVALVFATGVSTQGVQDAMYVCYVFNILTRLADAFDFDLTTPARWRVGGRIFHWFGYGATSLPG